tara:strand:+ start:11 stop:670 length:660 start_codon:yes stop_codon:yes gene_type:complete
MALTKVRGAGVGTLTSGISGTDITLSGGVNIFNSSTDSIDIRATGNRCEIDNPDNNAILLKTGGTTRIRVDPNGLLFGSDTAAANALDDYEIGSFNPTIEGSTTVGTGTYSVQKGYYEKIGDIVHYHGYVAWTAHTGAGNMKLKFPFTSANVNNGWSVVSFSYIRNLTTPANTFSTGAILPPNSTLANLQHTPVGGGANSDVAMDTNAQFMFSCTYRAS